MKRALMAVVILASLVFINSRADALVGVEGRYWLTDLDADLKVTDNNITGTDIDLTDDLGMDDEDFYEARISIGLGRHRIRYAYLPLSWDGAKTISKSITFNGRTYSANTFVDSSLDVTYHRLGYEYDVIDALGNRLGVIFEVKYFDIDAELESSTISESESMGVPLPAVGVTFQVGLPVFLSLGGEVTGISVGGNGYLVDAECVLNYKPAPLVTFSGGYRYLKLYAEKGDDEADLTLDGPFVTVKLRF